MTTSSQQDNKFQKTKTYKADSKAKTSSKRKKSKKLKVSYFMKPEKMSLEEWQIKLRKQVAHDERFAIQCVDEELCPGEYVVRNPLKNNDYKVVYRGNNSC